MTFRHIAILALALTATATIAGAQPTTPPNQSAPASPMQPGMGPMGSMPMHHPSGTPPMGGMAGHGMMSSMMGPRAASEGTVPTAPGQAAFGAIQEIVGLLQADPHTDWSKVDVDALRQHLIDMDEVTMRATARKEPLDNGLRIEISGTGRTLEAIQRMIPDHARDIDGLNGWTVRAATAPDGVILTVTAASPAEVQKIRALGFIGIMVQGGHHQMHHLAMAKGEPMHMH